ncbi:hypothetical protein [Paenibacillus endoradicis]|uniref:hypothetical protein n=1 Tax=Paenibacillus endoradicis TaxID=2972487 RepID=UPI00215983A7|nr:hypothetical protein [Paenibacillus endoradicis]MCR8657471.1 hypothetical protein [Paenibacillus endoradicis]
MQVFKSNKFWWIFALSIILIGCIFWIVMQNDKDKVERADLEVIVPTTNKPKSGDEHIDTVINDEFSVSEEVEPQYLTGSLQDDPSYDSEKVESITVQYGSNEPYTVPENREYVILQSLYWLDLTVAKAEDQTIADDNMMIHINSTDNIVAIPYDINKNTFQLGDTLYYATDEVAKMMYGQYKQESEIANIDRIYSNASKEAAESISTVNESFQYDYEQLVIDDMDFHTWKEHLSNDSKEMNIVNYYDNGSGKVSSIKYYEDIAVVSEREVIFISDSVATKDGIKIGLTKDEVLTTLGKSNLENDSQWSYKIGDYLKFHLYFEDNKVVLMSLTLPL